jgi:hypothetical protein
MTLKLTKIKGISIVLFIGVLTFISSSVFANTEYKANFGFSGLEMGDGYNKKTAKGYEYGIHFSKSAFILLGSKGTFGVEIAEEEFEFSDKINYSKNTDSIDVDAFFLTTKALSVKFGTQLEKNALYDFLSFNTGLWISKSFYAGEGATYERISGVGGDAALAGESYGWSYNLGMKISLPNGLFVGSSVNYGSRYVNLISNYASGEILNMNGVFIKGTGLISVGMEFAE